MKTSTREHLKIMAEAGVRLSTLTEEQVNMLVKRELDVESLSVEQLIEFLKIANATYRAGSPIISDAEYDLTYLAELRGRHPHHQYLQSVEPESAFEGKTVELPIQMLSTEKKYSMQDVEKWLKGVQKAGTDVSLDSSQITIRATPKLDGFAAYDDGERLYTRGDGRRGTDITRVFERGLRVGGNGRRGLGAGEIVVTKSYFEKYLATAFDNARNFQASIIREKGLDPLVEKAIAQKAAVFYPFASLPSWEGSADEFHSKFDEIVSKAWNSVDYDVDGVVFEVVNDDIKNVMGATPHHHRWQIAYKENLEKATVKVLDVRPQTSRSGRVNPVAELEPTRLSGATIKNVTAHHYKMVREKGLGPGALIELIRSGSVIPKIEKILRPVEPKIPDNCPSCGEKLLWDNDYLMCPNTSDCPAQIENTLEHFFKTIRNVDGFGSETIKKLHKNGIRSIPEVYKLDQRTLVNMGFGPKVSENLVSQLERSRTEPFEDWRFLAAFGVYRMGLGMCERLLQRFALEDVFNLTEEKLKTVYGFDKMTAKPVTEGLRRIQDRFWYLYEMGFNIQRTPLITEGFESQNSPIAGKRIVFTGAMKSGSRENMIRQAKALGARTSSSITGKTDLLITGENVGTMKINEAKALGVTIITENDYLALITKNQITIQDSDINQHQLSLFEQDLNTGK